MRHLLLYIFLALVAPLQATRHTLVVVSLDGFRWDYTQWCATPTLDSLARVGVEAGLIPSFPSKTFPNHYTLATGLYPDHHGIVANSFIDPQSGARFALSDAKTKNDPRFYGGEPIWLTAQRQGLRTAIFYWPGSDVKVQGKYPTAFHFYDHKPRLTLPQRVAGVLEQLAKPTNERPNLVMMYMEQPDKSGHNNGPQAHATQQAVSVVDSLVGRLCHGIRQLGLADEVNLVVLADHGMTWVDKSHQVSLAGKLRPEWIRAVEGTVPASIYAQPGYTDSIIRALQGVNHVRVWRRQDIPAYLHYGSNPRIGDVVVCPDLGYAVYEGQPAEGGNHGFDPTLQDMHALFRAAGPDLKHLRLPHFSNVEVYPLLCRLLGIQPAPCDGTGTVAEEIVK